MNRLTLKHKFVLLESVSFFMMLAIAIFGLFMLRGAINGEKHTVDRLKFDMEVAEAIDGMDMAIIKEAKLAKDVWLRGKDDERRKKYRAEFVASTESFRTNYETALTGIRELADGHPEFEAFISRLEGAEQAHHEMAAKYLAQIDVHKDTFLSDSQVAGIDRPPTKAVSDIRVDFKNLIEQKASEKEAIAEADYRHRRLMVIAWVLFSLTITATLSIKIVRQIMHQLGGDPKEVASIVNMMASGDFSGLPRSSLPAGSLLEDAYSMQQKLRDLIASVQAEAQAVGRLAHQLAASADQIAANANSESDAVCSMASAIEEFSVSITHIHEQGKSAQQIAERSRAHADHGAEVVNKTADELIRAADETKGASASVSRLGEDASRIGSVVKAIKEIADQTNLLALNAAIEAARAGESGRGFAVVADEVGKLAGRAASATHEIAGMSGNIEKVADEALSSMGRVVENTQLGVDDAKKTQDSIREIQINFQQVAAMMSEIASALSQQNAAASDLAQNTEKVSQMSEDNSRSAQHLLNVARDLEGKAAKVSSAVAVFKVA